MIMSTPDVKYRVESIQGELVQSDLNYVDGVKVLKQACNERLNNTFNLIRESDDFNKYSRYHSVVQ